jgi:predicted ATPase
MGDSIFLTRVVLENYKSIAQCQVPLSPLSFLVGPNGSGKSNFLDALRLITEALQSSLDHALRERGGVREVCHRRATSSSPAFGIRVDFSLEQGQRGFYAFRIGARPEGGYVVEREECRLSPESHFRVENGAVVSSTLPVAPAAASDRLYLVHTSGLPEFRPLYDSLSRMGFYNLNPDRVRDLQSPDPGDLLSRDGGNIASVLRQLREHSPTAKQRIEEYLTKIAAGVRHVEPRAIGPRETLEFDQQTGGRSWSFLAANMSDGTLRVLGVLVALFQSSNGHMRPVPLVAIEEPEAALHPAAAGVLLDALIEASRSTQVLVTSHSPDLLENDRIPAESILAVTSGDDGTRIGPLDDVGVSALRDHLYTPGELLRMNQLTPDPAAGRASAAGLFDSSLA